ncbi:MAG: GGDEF domain-containing response regulator [Candidatus Acidiferrales bacterium]
MTVLEVKQKKILVAEDDPVSRRVLEAFLLKWGYQVTTACNGEEALRCLESEDAPRLAVLDWMMPGMEGVQVCAKIRSTPSSRPYVYILLLTARTQKEDLLAGMEAGIDDYLTKPFDAQELRARLHVGQRIVNLQDQLIGAREELRYRATHDALTGIYNRGEIIEALNRERARQARDGGSFGVIIADLDHFKRVNDTYGHAAGDAVLRETTVRMKTCVRSYDFIGRYGGEEFLLVIPSSDAAGTLALAERIRQSIQSPPITTDAGEIKFTISLGVAASTPARPFGSQELLLQADQALYRAKENGRNRVELAATQETAASTQPFSQIDTARSRTH